VERSLRFDAGGPFSACMPSLTVSFQTFSIQRFLSSSNILSRISAMASSGYTDAVLLFVCQNRSGALLPADVWQGDSLTESWAAAAFAQRMSEFYNRKLDVVNRGFGGE
jgi:hypothetical protein